MLKVIQMMTAGAVLCAIALTGACFGAGSGAEGKTEQNLSVDVVEADGRYVTWKENECYLYEGDIRFQCRDGTFTQTLISFDEGRTYEPLFPEGFDQKERKSLVLPKDAYRNRQIILKFLARGEGESREFRLKSTGSDPGDSGLLTKDTFIQTPNVIN